MGRIFWAIAILFAVVATTARSAEPVASVPYRIDYGGWFTIAAMVNGEGPFDFIIDTGATHSLVFENLAELQDFRPTGGPLRTVFGLAAAGKFPPYRVGDVIVAPEVRLEGHESVILGDWLVDSASPQGVLGLDLLARYALLFDEAAGLLHFYAADAELNYPEDWGEIRLIPDDFGIAAGSLYTLVAYVERVRIPFMLDLGASGTIINRPAVERIASSYFRLNFGLHPTRLRDRITDALGKTEASRAYSVQRLRAGDVVWRSVVLYGHDGSIFEEIGAGDEAFGLFGSDMFRDRSFMIDFPRSRILVSKPSRTD